MKGTAIKISYTRFLFLFLMAVFSTSVSGQGSIKGKVTDGSGIPVEGATIVIDGTRGISTDVTGSFEITSVVPGQHQVAVSMLGYLPWQSACNVLAGETVNLDITLTLTYIEAGEIVVSATRTEHLINDIPTRVNLVSAKTVAATPALAVDDYLMMVPGVNVSRSFGIFSHKANVTMRGLSGKEQARVLVLIDGIPVNKADGGSVNWNLLDPDMVEHIEVVKGPASAVYGSNAMGGAINIITRKPEGKLAASIKAGYGSFNTVTGRINLSQHLGKEINKGFYYSLNGFHRQSDGYITQSDFDQQANPYIVPSNVWELSGNLKMGYDISNRENLELDLTVYDDERGTGEKVYKPNGNTTEHDTYQVRARYRVKEEKVSGDISVFWLKENYRKVNEYMKDDYTWYNVLSERVDAGLLSSVSYAPANRHTFSGGIDVKLGSVDAFDMYYTSTDIVYNRGRMFITGIYLQDEMTLVDKRLRIVAGLRYDFAHFFDGSFYIETPSAETAFMSGIIDRSMDPAQWNSLSPRISANYSINNDIRIYASLGRGFRPSVLDDLCRSGRMKGGFKLANPDVVPESLFNSETGIDVLLTDKLKVSFSAYYSTGKNFLYYVNTGDSIELSYGLRPVYVSTNIPEVRIGGVETEFKYTIQDNLVVTGSYSYSKSLITRYDPLDNEDPVDLTGRCLTDVPSHLATLTGIWNNRIVDMSLTGRYQGSMWVNDQNIFDEVVGSDRYPAYITCDLQISKEIRFVNLSLGIQNLIDTKFYDSSGAVCPGRFITFEAGVKL